MATSSQIFLSYAGENGFEASLLQWTLERLLADLEVTVWTFKRDQSRSEREVAESLRERIRESTAAIVLVSPSTLETGATQWMELAYADAFDVKTFVLLHQLTYEDLRKSDRDLPPLLMQGQCSPAIEWRGLEAELREACVGAAASSLKH